MYYQIHAANVGGGVCRSFNLHPPQPEKLAKMAMGDTVINFGEELADSGDVQDRLAF